MKKKLIAGALLTGAVVAGLYLWRSYPADASDRILISGNIEMTEVDVGFKTAGKLIERTVGEGDRVQKGQIVARLDHEQLLQQRDAAAAAVELARAQLTQAQTAVRYQREAMSADVA